MNDDLDCPSCGSTLAEREEAHRRMGLSYLDLHDCPNCGAAKCAMCDMGNDVACPSCPEEDE